MPETVCKGVELSTERAVVNRPYVTLCTWLDRRHTRSASSTVRNLSPWYARKRSCLSDTTS